MTDTITTFCLILCSPAAAGISSDSYAIREKAEARLKTLWPVSGPVVGRLLLSADPEVRSRAIRIAEYRTAKTKPLRYCRLLAYPTEQWWLLAVDHRIIRWDVVNYALTLPKGDLALRILYVPATDTRLPWLNNGIHRAYGKDNELRRTFCLIAKTMFPKEMGGGLLGCDPDLPHRSSDLSGVDNMRFWIRGLPDPQVDDNGAARKNQTQWVREMERVVPSQRYGLVPFPPLPEPEVSK